MADQPPADLGVGHSQSVGEHPARIMATEIVIIPELPRLCNPAQIPQNQNLYLPVASASGMPLSCFL
jgi:hypothetical protein